MSRLLLAAATMALLSGPSLAEDERPDCADPVTQADMNICAAADAEAADKALNAVYRQVTARMKAKDAELKEIDPDLVGAAEALKTAQRAWIGYRDGHCELAGFEARGGSMEPMLVSGCVADLTRKRTTELEDFLVDAEDQ